MSERKKARMKWSDVTPMPGNPIYPKRVEQMRRDAGGYVSALVGSPTIADNSELAFPELPEDTLLILDGGHRYQLASEEGQLSDEIIADLRPGLSRSQMYYTRDGLNNRRTVKPAERFLARCEQGDPHAVALKDAVERAGWRITYDRESGGIPCTNELEKIWQRDRGAMALALIAYEGAWGQEPYKAQCRVIKALGDFWAIYQTSEPAAKMDTLVGKLVKSKYTPDTLYAAGRNENEHLAFITSTTNGILYVMRETYNHGLGAKGKLPGRQP